MEVKLWEHQRRDVDRITDAFKEHQAVLYRLPTGGGKSLVACAVAKHYARVLVLVTRNTLETQWIAEVKRAGMDAISVRDVPSVEGKDPRGADWPEGFQVVVGTWQSAVRRYWRRGSRPTLVIVDEAHHSATPDAVAKINQVAHLARRAVDQGGRVLGLTATPIRLERDHGFDRVYSKLVNGADYPELQAAGKLVPLRVVQTARAVRGAGKAQDGDFTEGGTMDANSDAVLYDSPIAEIQRQAKGGKRMLVYAVGRRHAAHLANQIASAAEEANALLRKSGLDESVDLRVGLTISDPRGLADDLKQAVEVRDDVLVSDYLGKQDEAVEAFRAGKLNVLVSVDRLGEGFDVPDCDVAIILRPTQSIGLWIQMCGRVARACKETGKTEGVIIDMAGNLARHGKPDEVRKWRLKSLDRQQKKADRKKDAEQLRKEKVKLEKAIRAMKAALMGGGGGRSGLVTEEQEEEATQLSEQLVLTEAIAAAQDAGRQLAALQAQVDELENELAGAQSERDAALAKLAEAEAELRRLRNKLAATEQEARDAQRIAEGRLRDVKGKLEAAEERAGKLERALQEARKAAVEWKRRFDERDAQPAPQPAPRPAPQPIPQPVAAARPASRRAVGSSWRSMPADERGVYEDLMSQARKKEQGDEGKSAQVYGVRAVWKQNRWGGWGWAIFGSTWAATVNHGKEWRDAATEDAAAWQIAEYLHERGRNAREADDLPFD